MNTCIKFDKILIGTNHLVRQHSNEVVQGSAHQCMEDEPYLKSMEVIQLPQYYRFPLAISEIQRD
jgi:hypothetical protein